MKKPYKYAKFDSLNITLDMVKNPASFIGVCVRYGWFITLFLFYMIEYMRGNLKNE